MSSLYLWMDSREISISAVDLEKHLHRAILNVMVTSPMGGPQKNCFTKLRARDYIPQIIPEGPS